MQHIPFFDEVIYQSNIPIEQMHYDVMKLMIRGRYKKGWSQWELANALETTQPIISRIENLKVYPNMEMLLKMAHALNLRLTLVE